MDSSTTERKTWGPVEVDQAGVDAFGAGIDHHGSSAHPMFVAKALIPGSAKVLMSPGIGIDIQRIVHAGLLLRFRERARIGDQMTTDAWLQAVDEKASGTLVSIGVEIQVGERVLADGVTRYFSRGASRGATRAVPEPLSGEGLQVMEVETTEDQSLRYAEGSGDRFPIHTSNDFARAVGLPGVIMHGMCTLSLCIDAIVERLLDGDLDRMAEVECRFASNLLPGQSISLRALPGDQVRFEARRPDGKLVISEGRISRR